MISLGEFREISGFSDTAIVWLLINNLLSCSIDPQKGLLIDVESLDYKKLTAELGSKLEDEFVNRESLVSARLTEIVKTNLAAIITEAMRGD